MLHEIDVDKVGPRGEAMAGAIAKCVHCGFCLPACPTYQELESEMDSPRGRILLMKSVLEGKLDAEQAQPHIDRCLGCLACVSHCPSGVEYGELVTSYRDRQEELRSTRKWSLRDRLAAMTLPYAERFRWAVRLGQATRALRYLAPKSLRPMMDLIPREIPQPQPLPEVTPAIGTRRGRVALLAGCAQQVIAPDINAAAVRVLSRNGIDVVVPQGQGCCGALSWHTGQGAAAKRFGEELMSKIPQDVDCLLTTAAGCGSAIAEYPLLFEGTNRKEEAESFASRTLDISVYLSQLELAPIPELKKPVRAAYQDACHLAHAQKVRLEPRRLLSQISGLEVCELADRDTCCGSAGTYNIEQPEIAASLGRRKVADALSTRPDLLVTGNIGCLVQLQKHLEETPEEVPVLHTVQVLDRAYQEILS